MDSSTEVLVKDGWIKWDKKFIAEVKETLQKLTNE